MYTSYIKGLQNSSTSARLQDSELLQLGDLPLLHFELIPLQLLLLLVLLSLLLQLGDPARAVLQLHLQLVPGRHVCTCRKDHLSGSFRM